MATSPFKFVNEVRSEISKVVWPTRRETTITTAMVFIMAAIASLFFFMVDQLVHLGLSGVINMF